MSLKFTNLYHYNTNWATLYMLPYIMHIHLIYIVHTCIHADETYAKLKGGHQYFDRVTTTSSFQIIRKLCLLILVVLRVSSTKLHRKRKSEF